MSLPKKGEAYVFYVALVDAADPTGFKVDPTVAVGDFKISKDGGAFANLSTLPVVAPAGSPMLRISLTSTEMTADDVSIWGVDQAGSEWQDFIATVEIPLGSIDDLYQLHGLDEANPLTVTPAARDAGAIHQNISGDGETTTTVTRT